MMLESQTDRDFIKAIIPRFSPSTRVKLLYRLGEDDLWNLKDYRKKVHGKGATVVLVKSGVGWVAGGYTSVPWSAPAVAEQVRDDEAVLFSVTHKKAYPIID